jgi:hypothetical protein
MDATVVKKFRLFWAPGSGARLYRHATAPMEEPHPFQRLLIAAGVDDLVQFVRVASGLRFRAYVGLRSLLR